MRFIQIFLTACLLASFGCNIGDDLNLDLTGLGTEPLTVFVTTGGDNPDPDGYLLSITNLPEERIGINESMIFHVLRIDVTVELSDIAANCTVADNPQTVTVRRPTTVTFLVECP